MTGEEAIAGLVLYACELLNISRGGKSALEPSAGLPMTKQVEASENSSFSEERFALLGAGLSPAAAAEFLSFDEKRAQAPDYLSPEARRSASPDFLDGGARIAGSEAGYMEGTELPSPVFGRLTRPERAAGARLTPERFSEYLERDSRRYDGGYETY